MADHGRGVPERPAEAGAGRGSGSSARLHELLHVCAALDGSRGSALHGARDAQIAHVRPNPRRLRHPPRAGVRRSASFADTVDTN